ncbi:MULTISPECIES: hypothetical protein [Arthrobacter]|uniref:hypothetical protein n=1 Tax=Arthrobacter TaxID=1663 RepID=UPI001D143F20|nr:MULTISPECIES: hypothetical protein [Arthrobacter]MCC3282639.1 hypothetical protein [Arthrobacter caoxuetaonis]MCC9193681.1 hypothetical protein [Arthrobacter sp. zg-Y916]
MAEWRKVFGPRGQSYRRVLGAAAAAVSAAGVYFRIIRPQLRRTDAGGELPGDSFLSGKVLQYTHSMMVPAQAGDVWPYLNRVGHSRAGWYVFNRLAAPDSTAPVVSLLPPRHELDVGDVMSSGTGQRLRIKEVQPNEWMLWADGDSRCTWLWMLQSVRLNQTRLLVRGRFRYAARDPGSLAAAPLAAVDWATMRRCVRTIRDRAAVRSATRLGNPNR